MQPCGAQRSAHAAEISITIRLNAFNHIAESFVLIDAFTSDIQARTESLKSFSQISDTKAEIELKHNIVDRDSHSSRSLRNEWSNVRTKRNKIEKQNTLPKASDEEMG